MAGRTTDFPDGSRIKAFRACVEIVKEDPGLAGRIKKLSTWDGEPGDKSAPATGQFPYLQMSPVMMPNQRNGERHLLAVLGIRFRIAVAGLVAEDLVNYWDAIEAAFVRKKTHRGQSVLCFLQSFGVWDSEMVSPGIDAWQPRGNGPDQFLQGDGTLVLKINAPA